MKKFLLALVVFAISNMASAAYLYWQLDTSDYDGSQGAQEYNQINVKSNSETPVNVYGLVWDSDENDYVLQVVAPENVQSGVVYAFDSSQIQDGFSYYIELANYDSGTGKTTVVNRSSSISASDIASYSSAATVTSDLTKESTVPVWHSSSGMSPVPEPTSGFMMLLGAAMLGLKRKQRRLI